MKVRLLGAGAVGCPLAVRLEPVSSFALIMDSGRIGRYRALGCTVNGVRHDFDIAEEDESDTDLIILSCKNTDLSSAMDVVEHHVGSRTVIMSLLNGIESEEILARRFGQDRLVWSFITNLSSVREGRKIDCFSPRGGQIIFNERDSRVTDRIRAIAGLFDRAGIWYEISSDILHDMWWKFAFNIIVNSLSAVMRLDYSQMNDNNAFRRLVRMLYHEIRAVALSEGIRLTVDDEERCFAVLGSMNGRGKTSMLQDVEAGRETENRFFAGSLSALGKKHSLPTPLCDMLYTMVEAASGACRE